MGLYAKNDLFNPKLLEIFYVETDTFKKIKKFKIYFLAYLVIFFKLMIGFYLDILSNSKYFQP